MKTDKLYPLIIVLIFPVLICSCATVGIEKAKYTVLEKKGSLELRQYEPQIIAETTVDADFDQAGNMAFNRLYNYISGRNITQESIRMTAPVNQAASAEKIAMTAPVNQQQTQGKYAVSFLMPSKYSLETIPQPLDSSVQIRQVPARKIAAIRYSGTWSQKRYEQKKTILESFIQEKGLNPTDQPIFARYDPPFQLWFLRRNEVLIPVD
ncbi:MAG TPA: heme-binding protein [Anaerohalosphaeraceae bacterium]|nr:heme-binding protein [Anaerohalosphaeraceae bacterium]